MFDCPTELSSPSPVFKSPIQSSPGQVQDPNLKSELDWGRHYNPTGHHHKADNQMLIHHKTLHDLT